MKEVPSPTGHDPALRAVIAYKTVRGALALTVAMIFALLLAAGQGPRFVGFTEHLVHHATHAWSVHAAKAIFDFAGSGHLWLVSVALAFDGALTLFEGWALHHRRWWGPWLVVVATGVLVPIEVEAFVRHPHVGRAVILVVNVTIVVFLARRAIAEHRRKGAIAP
jgi:uncharacterized membrane protein (DUF2068 family)